ncbi:hypothetical protein ATJ78_3023 [Paramicrobacterium agarici]|uniref:Uncharacterized protein n=1 Tax=Paramicrobacterium agarici TaxID=630514 RepID=A0A2A9E1G8_9MICO|nr:hypothetical protein ATJ78_3023 [Microbacterium agarici]
MSREGLLSLKFVIGMKIVTITILEGSGRP